ncbi:hypothetical protein [Nonomuraea sp. NPDC003709]|uniref:hypothetical protein n=1 Tax=Nonomuraea sp. NPDC003709 TaxID=3154450 RepID=UPI0033ACFAA5
MELMPYGDRLLQASALRHLGEVKVWQVLHGEAEAGSDDLGAVCRFHDLVRVVRMSA